MERLILLGTLSAALLSLLLVQRLRVQEPGPPERRVVPVALENVSGISWDGEALWVTVDGTGVIHRVDPDSGAIDRRIELGVAETGGSAWDGESLWQLAYLEKRIYRLALPGGEVLETLPAPGGGICSGMTYDGRALLLANPDDRKIYRIDPRSEGRVLTSYDADFETTGLIWDAGRLWNGVLVGTTEDHAEETPYTGFVQRRDLATGKTLAALPVQGVFAGGSDGFGSRRAQRMWWFDGYHQQLIEFRWHRPAISPAVLAAVLAAVNLILGGCVWMLWRARWAGSGAPGPAPAPRTEAA